MKRETHIALMRGEFFNPGIFILVGIYGAAGCGKTETVLQLARSTGRAILRVNPQDIQEKFVGESVKNVKYMFDRYRRLVKKTNEKKTSDTLSYMV